MIINIKMKSGFDLIGQAETIEQQRATQSIAQPLKIEVTPEFGMALSMYAAFAKDGIINIPRSEIVYVTEASDIALEKYQEIMTPVSDAEDDLYEDEAIVSFNKYIH